MVVRTKTNRYETQAELVAATRRLLNPAQLETCDQMLAMDGAWSVNSSYSVGDKTVVWLEDRNGTYIVGINLAGKVERPVKGKNKVAFNSRTLERTW